MAAPSYPPGTQTVGLSQMNAAPTGMTTGITTNPFSPYFGEPPRELKLNPYSLYGRENWALPEAYKGSNMFMTQLMITVIKDEDLWPTRVVLPIRITESEQEIAWDEVVFNNHLLGPVPEEGVSRLVTQSTSERKDHYVRYGIALILEHGFMKTPKGQESYRMNIMQIRNATLETMYFGVIEALLKSKQYSNAWMRRYGQMARSGSALRGYIGEEVAMYMVVQKSEHGFDILDTRAKKQMRLSNVTPDTWVLPEGLGTYLALVRPENNTYLLKGPEGVANYNSALNAAPVSSIRQMAANSCQVFESKSFDMPSAPQAIDPLVRNVSIGEYNTMCDTVSDMVDPERYKSFMRDIFVYNENRDDFSRISLRAALKACCRFDSGDNLYFPPAFGMGSMAKDDPFMMPNGQPCYVFGDMSKMNLSDETLKKLAESVAAKFPVPNHAVQGAEAATFLAQMQMVFPQCRLFDPVYQANVGGFVNNAVTLVPGGLRGAGGALQNNDPIAPLPIGQPGLSTPYADIRAKIHDVIKTTDEPSPSEMALNNSTIDKFMSKVEHAAHAPLPARLGDASQATTEAVGRLLAAFQQLKDIAKNATPAWTKHFAFAMHKCLLAFAQGAGFDLTALTGQVRACVGDAVRLAQLQGSSTDVIAAIPLAATPPAAGVVPFAGQTTNIGAEHRFGALRRQTGHEGTVGEFADDVYDSQRTGQTAAFKTRFQEIMDNMFPGVVAADTKDQHMRAIILTFLHTPICEKALANLIDKDIFFPFDFLLFRPRITHQMATGILLKAGSDTGETLVGHADFQLADDVVRKMHYGNFTLYSKSIVYKSDNVFLAENILANGYVGGNDVSMNTLQSLQSGDQPRSMFVALVPLLGSENSEGTTSVSALGQYPNPLDITGKFANGVPHLANLDMEVGNPQGLEHYPGASFYAMTFGMNNSNQTFNQEYVYAEMNTQNTICFQGHQTMFNPAENKWDMTIVNTGHFGDRIYSGCGRVRRGQMKFLEPVSYTTQFGSTKSLTVVGA